MGKQKLSFWKRLLLKIERWWLFHFKNDTLWECELNGFRYVVRKYWIDIHAIALNHWNIRIGTANYAYAYLLSALMDMQRLQEEGKLEEAEETKKHFSFFTTNLYLTSSYLLQDIKFAKGLSKEIDWAVKRTMRKAQEEASKVTQAEEDSAQAFMESAVERGSMTRQQRRKAEREERKEMQKVASEIVDSLSKEE